MLLSLNTGFVLKRLDFRPLNSISSFLKRKFDETCVSGDKQESQSASAKTVTLTSNGTVLSGASPSVRGEVERDPEEAATKIQAAFRGHQTRKSMKQPGKQDESEPTPEQLREEFRSDDTGERWQEYGKKLTLKATFSLLNRKSWIKKRRSVKYEGARVKNTMNYVAVRLKFIW